jgi:integrase
MNAITTFEACEAVPALLAADLEIAKDFARASKATAHGASTKRTSPGSRHGATSGTFRRSQRHRRPSRHFLPRKPPAASSRPPSAGASPQSAMPTSSRATTIRRPAARWSRQPCTASAVRWAAAPVRKTPATADKVVAMAALADTDIKGLRDRAILLFGFAGAFRRSELVALDVTDLEFCDGGMRVHVRRSKTDQEGAGDTIAIAWGSLACPVKGVRAWLEASNVTTGPLLRPITKGGRIGTGRRPIPPWSGSSRRAPGASGLDPKLFAGHSLRSGFLTSAAGRGASIFKMMDQSRHSVLRTDS